MQRTLPHVSAVSLQLKRHGVSSLLMALLTIVLHVVEHAMTAPRGRRVFRSVDFVVGGQIAAVATRQACRSASEELVWKRHDVRFRNIGSELCLESTQLTVHGLHGPVRAHGLVVNGLQHTDGWKSVGSVVRCCPTYPTPQNADKTSSSPYRDRISPTGSAFPGSVLNVWCQMTIAGPS
eukprot:CAMPEP_0175983564 /NCGR_PEP_ID=MMETSP0108-20121206/48518_1 /TAXON_ID=195067 ORGANISM="Goniomonas pacifica, Strain CCMP1869" /NCGR_SAMPLE_ID=MMETSP0108 /ASSEMBLY_ACC=CAM_ASM_000204 /LENGTH=178 /DNA_ID=CAMNT_0017314333 /DNA_START=197 /DNA_END=733 /DNA_ORIENTATION=-